MKVKHRMDRKIVAKLMMGLQLREAARFRTIGQVESLVIDALKFV